MQGAECPPVLILAHRRSNEFKQVLGRVLEHQPESLYISCDGPRNSDEKREQDQMRKIIRESEISVPFKVRFLERNIGLRLAVLSGVDWFFENVPFGIVLEDDLLPTGQFFDFCSQGLSRYSSSESVLQISGYRRLPGFPGRRQHVFHPRIDCWGWATWKDRWEKFRIESGKHMQSHVDAKFAPPGLFHEINIGHQKARIGELDSWAYSWAQFGLATRSLALVPAENTVENVGFGPQATHTTRGRSAIPKRFNQDVIQFPTEIRPSLLYAYTDHLVGQTGIFIRRRKKEGAKAARIIVRLLGRFARALKIFGTTR